MNRNELREAFKWQVIAEDHRRREQLLKDENITDEAIKAYMFSQQDDELTLQLIEFIIQMDEKLDKILEKLG